MDLLMAGFGGGKRVESTSCFHVPSFAQALPGSISNLNPTISRSMDLSKSDRGTRRGE